MNSEQIVSRMNSYLHTSAEYLAKWLSRFLPKASENWWEECVLDKLSHNQSEIALKKGFTKLDEFDLAALLRIADKSWYILRTVVYLPNSERECIHEMMKVRNNWAHCGADLPGKDEICSDLAIIHQFLGQLEANRQLLDEVEQTAAEVRSPSSVDFDFIADTSAVLEQENPGSISNLADEEEISEKALVCVVGSPGDRGIVIRVTDMGNTKKYDVFVNGSFKTYYSGQIELYREKPVYNWVNGQTFRSYLTAYQINHPSGQDLYSLNAARIDFVPYQFRPALKLIHADEPRILIADSVGVGKTIEAGIIIKELQARRDLDRILIICPKPLVSERKWEMEMKRFDEEFIPVDGKMLQTIISDTDRDGEWPERYGRVIVPYSVLNRRTYEGESKRGKPPIGLSTLDPEPHFDLVIVDEAHHIRNGSMEKDKAYEYKCVKYFCDHADAVVMLTATPLQTSDDDLYTLLNVLRPDVVIDKPAFNLMSKPNGYLSRCESLIRSAKDNWQEQARQELKGVLDTQWGENVISANPAYQAAVRTLSKDAVTRQERIQLLSDLESLHSFHSMLNRTRRKDIQDFCVRRSTTVAVEFTEAQKALNDGVLTFEYLALQELHGNARNISFMMTTIKRQAASCIFGLAPHIQDLVNRRFAQLEDDPDAADYSIDSKDCDVLKRLSYDLLKKAENLPEEDPKFDGMLEFVRQKQTQDNNKIILFSTFRYTLAYLRRKLKAAGLRVGQIDGSVKEEERQELRNRFELPKEDKFAIDIMLFTEVGSEGLDYQFCNTMINYDLPWNPMKIEQRIGRIDRRGQRSETVTICNVITNGTVDADIYYRCLDRIGIFSESIGECDAILGDIASGIEEIATDPALTDEERRVKLEQMADNELRRIREISKLEEEEKDLFGFDLSEYTTSQEIHRAENPWLTTDCLFMMVEQYLNHRLGEGTYIIGEGALRQLRLSRDARCRLREDLNNLSMKKTAVRQAWEAYLKGSDVYHTITFDSEAAEKDRTAFFVTAVHPLAKQAAAFFNKDEKTYIHMNYKSDDFAPQTCRFCVYAWNFVGINPHFRLIVVCENEELTQELPEILQSAETGAPIDIRPDDWDDLEKKQINLWMKAQQEAKQEAYQIEVSKIERLTNNFKYRKRSLQQKIADDSDERMRRMHTGELEATAQKYESEMEEIREKSRQTDIHTSLIANGVLEILH